MDVLKTSLNSRRFFVFFVFERNIICLSRTDHNYKPSFIKSPLILERHENTKEGFQLADISQYAKDDEGDKLLYKLDTSGNEICTIGLTDGKLRLKIRPDREVCYDLI